MATKEHLSPKVTPPAPRQVTENMLHRGLTALCSSRTETPAWCHGLVAVCGKKPILQTAKAKIRLGEEPAQLSSRSTQLQPRKGWSQAGADSPVPQVSQV